MTVDDRVLLVAGGQSVFTILEIDDDGYALVKSVTDAPGSYPFPVRLTDLVPVEPQQ